MCSASTYIAMAIKMPAPELRDDAERADEDQSQGDEEDDHERCSPGPEGSRGYSQAHQEALALCGISHYLET